MNKSKMFSLSAGIVLATALTFSCSSGDDPNEGGEGSSSSSGGGQGGGSSSGGGGGNTVSWQGKEYRTAVIGSQTWFAENLNYNVSGSKCYDNSDSNCGIYGRLYDWSTAMDLPSNCNISTCSNLIQSPHQGICPEGWHIPSEADWDALMTAVGGADIAGTKLKATSGWNENGNGTDNYGFSALPGGGGSDGSFEGVGYSGLWCSASENENNGIRTYFLYMLYYRNGALWNGDDKSLLFSVRCAQD